MMRLNLKNFSLIVIVAIVAFMIAATCLAWWVNHRDDEPLSPSTLMAHKLKVREWLQANESKVLRDGNSALWWMVRLAADREQDPYLLRLVGKAAQLHYGNGREHVVWRRMLEPNAAVQIDFRDIASLQAYQAFYHHAMTCVPIDLPQGSTKRFLKENLCQEGVIKAAWRDPVCTTHHVIGLNLMSERSECHMPSESNALKAEMLLDIHKQLTWDPLLRDAQIQRLLVLAINNQHHKIHPHWLRRMLSQQEPDGGWLGHARIPELGILGDSRFWRRLLGPTQEMQGEAFDFHATAQVILLLTLLTTPNQS